LPRFGARAADPAAVGDSVSVLRFVFSADTGGVAEGCRGGGCRWSATGLRPAQPAKIHKQTTPNTLNVRKVLQRL
jgi:hypothetical protein